MTLHEFIFAKKRPVRFFRHIVFWMVQFGFWAFWATIFFVPFGEGLAHGVKFYGYPLGLHISYTYLIAYCFLPEYLERKRLSKFIISVLILSVVTYALYVLLNLWVGGRIESPRNERLLMTWFFSMNFIINGPPVICAMFLTFKMLKNYYIKIEEKLALTIENTNAELQLLKAQVHPHFLFNTLNNIYSFALTKSPKTGSLVLKLSDTLRYMINDCNADLVPLQKELKMVTDYIELEKVRYGNRLNMEVEINGNSTNKLIAPLLLIPFVENSFKHGASMLRGRQWVKLNILIQDSLLDFNLSNSKPLQPIAQNGKKGIGLLNVQKRLQLLYPGKHVLKIETTGEVYFVQLQVVLQEHQSLTITKGPISEPQSVSYA